MRVSGAIEAKNISGTVEQPLGAEEDYERAMRDAMARMEKGFPMSEIPKLDREALYDRAPLWPGNPAEVFSVDSRLPGRGFRLTLPRVRS